MNKVCKGLAVFAVLLAVGIVVYNSLSVHDYGYGNGGTVNWGEDLEALVIELSKDAETDKSCVQEFYQWIIENIEYDYELDGIYQYENISKTLRTKKGICFDYALLFAAMCRSRNIRCHVVDGYLKSDPSSKHTWNRVYFDGRWWNVDATNDAARLRNGQPLYGFHPLEYYDEEDADYVITRIY